MEAKTYTITEVQEILQISRTKAYDYIRKVYQDGCPFKVLKVGDSYRIPKAGFDKWLNGEQVYSKIFENDLQTLYS